MPEYLSPGVYVEEVDTGSKPIEGVSTSTAGMVGVTERGPVNVPMLVTGAGEFQYWFGGHLNPETYAAHRYLPHAVEGFFTNGGKRLYVVRTLNSQAKKAQGTLFDRGDESYDEFLAAPAAQGNGGDASPIYGPVGLLSGDFVRIGEGSQAEYRKILSSASEPDIQISPPASRAYAAGSQVEVVTFKAPKVQPASTQTHLNLDQAIVDVPANGNICVLHNGVLEAATLNGPTGTSIDLAGTGLTDTPALNDLAFRALATDAATTANAGDASLKLSAAATLDKGTLLFFGGQIVRVQKASTGVDVSFSPPLIAALNPSSTIAVVDDMQLDQNANPNVASLEFKVDKGASDIGLDKSLTSPISWISITQTKRGPDFYKPTLGAGSFSLQDLNLAAGLVADYAAGSQVQAAAFPLTGSVTGTKVWTLTDPANLTAGMAAGSSLAALDTDGNLKKATLSVVAPPTVTVDITLLGAGPFPVFRCCETTADAKAGGTVLTVDDRSAIKVGSLLYFPGQIVRVTHLTAPNSAAPNPGKVVIFPALSQAIPSQTVIGVFPEMVLNGNGTLAVPAAKGDTDIYSDEAVGAANGWIGITASGQETAYYTLNSIAAVSIDSYTLDTDPANQLALFRDHALGAALAKRIPLLEVEALDAGAWGNRLRISSEDEEKGLVSTRVKEVFGGGKSLRLNSATGVESGTLLRLWVNGAEIDKVKVASVNRASNSLITLDTASAALDAAVKAIQEVTVTSCEFRMTVSLLQQPDPSTPSRNEQMLDREVFRHLSMDPRHSRYVVKIIGLIDGTPVRKSDQRPEGESLYIRVKDLGDDAAKASNRLGPEPLKDRQKNGTLTPALMMLEDQAGDDAIPALQDTDYVGDDNVDPEKRTGLWCLKNVDDVSIVGIPGITSESVQQGLIDHCEALRYRFAVLDSVPEPNDTIVDVQDQRQQFDTKYAALYYPWLAIPDPYPSNLANVAEVAIPPAGHVLGVYARTDITRGVFKAPANEVVNGIVNLRRKLNKEQQDVLNPFPVNINVIRDFWHNFRGIRIYGGRVITSDSDWKYVNVRRLIIYIEASIDRGLQWVVFEPNAEPLWARVERSITNFLTGVWRDGGLEGTTPKEAFFVKCDRTTMTQTDIDSGRLIVQVGVAPVKPAEFVIVRIGLWTAYADS